MPAPKGNEYYLLRSKDGRDTEYNPDTLLEGVNEYFIWCLENPLKEEVVFHAQGQITKTYVDKMRAFTIHGLCNFLDICVNTFKNYEKNKDLMTVSTRARQIIYNQKFEGAASGFLKESLIARDLGLADKKDLVVKGELNYTTEEREKRIKDLLKKKDAK